MKSKKRKGAVLTGVIAAIAASSCCIPPIIAAIAGLGGASSSMAWMEPFRPYLIGIAVIAIGYAWYAHLKVKKEDDCGCEIEKPRFFQTRGFLVGMTLFAAISIGFPYYSHIFISDNQQDVRLTESSEVRRIKVSIAGMTCNACQIHVNQAVNELNGILIVEASYNNRNAIVEFDTTQTTESEIKKAVNSTGYSVLKIESIKGK